MIPRRQGLSAAAFHKRPEADADHAHRQALRMRVNRYWDFLQQSQLSKQAASTASCPENQANPQQQK